MLFTGKYDGDMGGVEMIKKLELEPRGGGHYELPSTGLIITKLHEVIDAVNYLYKFTPAREVMSKEFLADCDISEYQRGTLLKWKKGDPEICEMVDLEPTKQARLEQLEKVTQLSFEYYKSYYTSEGTFTVPTWTEYQQELEKLKEMM